MATQPMRHLAQLNIGRLRYELDDPRMADFVNNLARVNAIADRAEGFVWRLQDASGNATSYRPYGDDPRMAINMSVWENVAALERYVWQTVHKRFYGRRHEWFEKLDGPYFVMWWVSEGHISDTPRSGRTAGIPQTQRAERLRLRLGKPAGRAALEDGTMRMTTLMSEDKGGFAVTALVKLYPGYGCQVARWVVWVRP
jgi:hypothetical protein